jgi:transcriptional regulator GlxA family with amidase domain
MADMMNAIDQYRRSGRRIKLIGYLSMLCSQFMEDKPGVVPHIEDRELLIYEFFSKKYNQDVSLSDLAGLLNLSKKQTERMVEKFTGRSFRAEIAHHRMEAAAQLMKIPGLSLSDIATRVGYKSYSGFWKAYKAASQNVL